MDQHAAFDGIFWVAILSSSLLGSAHCVGMCGALASVSRSRRDMVLYHLGRLFSYSLAVLFLGQVVRQIFDSPWGVLVPILMVCVTTALLLLFAVKTWKGARFKNKNLLSVETGFTNTTLSINHAERKKLNLVHRIQTKIFGWILKIKFFRSFAVGGVSAVLPCGWLYTFVALAALQESTVKSMSVITLFWLGTVPALAVFQWGMARTAGSTTVIQKQALGLAMGVFAILFFVGRMQSIAVGSNNDVRSSPIQWLCHPKI